MQQSEWRRWYRLYALFVVAGVVLLSGYYLWQPLVLALVIGWVLVGVGVVMTGATLWFTRRLRRRDVWSEATRERVEQPAVFSHDYGVPGGRPRPPYSAWARFGGHGGYPQ
jgi:hypothetical protein